VFLCPQIAVADYEAGNRFGEWHTPMGISVRRRRPSRPPARASLPARRYPRR
jgi:hypothetical protein